MPNQFFSALSDFSWLNHLSLHTVVAVLAIVLALGFDFVNGFNDTANACATVIYTRALKPGTAIFLSGLLNFLGALLVGTAVAQVITKIIPVHTVSLSVITAVLIAALIWNLTTWWFRIPISSSHCLIGSLFGAGLMAAGVNGVAWSELAKVFAALIISPFVGFMAGCAMTWIGIKLSALSTTNAYSVQISNSEGANATAGISPMRLQADSSNTGHTTTIALPDKMTVTVNKKRVPAPPLMRWLHILASCMVSFSHGSNDGQKTMGIITLILASHFTGYGYTINHVPFWVMVACAVAIGLGTTIGGWRIIKTVGSKISREPLTHAQGFGASMATALIILLASRIGAPISTTHTLNSAVAGGTIPSYGAAKLNSKTMRAIVLAWVLTVPATAALAAICYTVTKLILG